MDKKKIILQLRQAKSAHIKWRAYAQALVSGLPVEKEHLPVIHTDCAFGQWYYGDGQHLSHLSSFDAISTPHEMLHQVYINIYKLLYGEDERSTLKKIFGRKSSHDPKKEARILLQDLLSISGTLLEAIALLENEVNEMSAEDFSKIFQ
ncbi:MAG: CZB domain-containing protein [Gammaproteobacteria bacterium]|nr:CZB domain-containing protein [Gammaproteobacteria bacterium]